MATRKYLLKELAESDVLSEYSLLDHRPNDSELSFDKVKATIYYSEPIIGIPEEKSIFPDFLRKRTLDYRIKSMTLSGIDISGLFDGLPYAISETKKVAKDNSLKLYVDDSALGNAGAFLFENKEISENFPEKEILGYIESFRKTQQTICDDLEEARKNLTMIYPWNRRMAGL